MNRRGFVRSLGGAVAAALVGFLPTLKLSLPNVKKKDEFELVDWESLWFWFSAIQRDRECRGLEPNEIELFAETQEEAERFKVNWNKA